jgi:hypothetical protein
LRSPIIGEFDSEGIELAVLLQEVLGGVQRLLRKELKVILQS